MAALGLAACGDDAPTTSDPLANSGWDSNGAPTFLKTAPTGTLLGAAAKNTVFACIRVQIPGTGNSIVLGQTAGKQVTQASTPWVQNGNVVISKIDVVPLSMTMESDLNVTETTTTRRLKGNGVPNHPIGVFPIPRSSSSYPYYSALPAEGYANAAEIPVKPYDLDVTLPREPKLSATPTCIAGLMTGCGPHRRGVARRDGAGCAAERVRSQCRVAHRPLLRPPLRGAVPLPRLFVEVHEPGYGG